MWDAEVGDLYCKVWSVRVCLGGVVLECVYVWLRVVWGVYVVRRGWGGFLGVVCWWRGGRAPRCTLGGSSAASDGYKGQGEAPWLPLGRGIGGAPLDNRLSAYCDPKNLEVRTSERHTRSRFRQRSSRCR